MGTERDSFFDLSTTELPSDLFAIEVEPLAAVANPAAGCVSTWASLSTFGTASCPAGCASTKATASTYNCASVA
jgi:hypothetical protein